MTEERDRSVTESNPSVYEPASSADTPIESAAWLFSGTAAHIDEFILAGSSWVCSEHLHAIVKEGQRIYEKVYAIIEVGLNDLKRQTRLIMQTLEFAGIRGWRSGIRSASCSPSGRNVRRSIPAGGGGFFSRSDPRTWTSGRCDFD
jgi:hypothetical protein